MATCPNKNLDEWKALVKAVGEDLAYYYWDKYNSNITSKGSTASANIKFEEEQSSGYRNRTIKNASADATIAIAVDFNTAGEKLTKSSVLSQNKKYISIDANNLTVTKERVDKIVEQLNSAKEYTSENITSLKPNEVFVFGSNAEGVHGKGAALLAKTNFGAKQGQSEGLQGQSYAIITKKNWRVEKSSTLNDIFLGIEKMLQFAKNNPDKKFLVTKIGSSLAGYSTNEIKEVFKDANNVEGIPNNVILPKEYEIRGITLNIAGNGIYTMKGKYTQQQVDDFTYELLNQVLNSPNLKTKIISIRSGGQTGFDEAGAKAGIKLGLSTIVLAPKGWTFRDVTGKDISNEQQFKERFNKSFTTIEGMPFSNELIDRVKSGKQKYTIRQHRHKEGLYVHDNELFLVKPLSKEVVNINTLNKEDIIKNFKADQEIREPQIKAFLEGKNSMYVYEIQHIKVDKPSQDQTRVQPQIKTVKLPPIKDNLVNTIKEFLINNGVKVEFLDSLVSRFGDDYNGVFDVLNKLVAIKNGEEQAIAEEAGHAIVDGLGENNVLIARLLELITPELIKAELDPRYKEIYKNDLKALKKELAGQYIGKAFNKQEVAKKDANKGLIARILEKIKNKFLSLFKNAKPQDLEGIRTELNKISEELSSKALAGELVLSFPDYDGTNITPKNPLYFQVKKNKQQSRSTEAMKASKRKQYFGRRKARLNSDLKALYKQGKDEHSSEVMDIMEEINTIEQQISAFKDLKEKDSTPLFEYWEELEIKFAEYIQNVKANKIVPDSQDVYFILKGLELFPTNNSERLTKDITPLIDDIVLREIREKYGEVADVSIEDINALVEDLGKRKTWTGALSDVVDYLAATIGAVIKEAQNKVSTENKKLTELVSKQIDALREYSKKNKLTLEQVYDYFIQEEAGTLVFTKKYNSDWYNKLTKAVKDRRINGSDSEGGTWLRANASWNEETRTYFPKAESKWLNENYIFIHKPENKALADFYKFYTVSMKEALNKLPLSNRNVFNENFIANIKRSAFEDFKRSDNKVLGVFKSSFKSIFSLPVYENEELTRDAELDENTIPLRYTAAIKAEEKSRDIGENLLRFISFANHYDHMNEVLPKVRVLQNKLQSKGFTKKGKTITGEDSNYNKLVEAYITTQIKEERTKKEGEITIGNKKVYLSQVADWSLRYNSLLRIGLNPINAVANVLVGDIGNIIEAFGSKFFSFKGLHKATTMFNKDALQNRKNWEESKTFKLLTLFNPLQELTDYENIEKVSINKNLTPDRLHSLMFDPQKKGELFLQTRTLLAHLMHKKVTTKEGKQISMMEAFDEKGNWNTELMGYELKQHEITAITDLIQRLNQKIHGRYSSRDVALGNQYMLFRLVFQFRKWIPAAYEARFDKKQFDRRLGVEIEGRWRTLARLIKERRITKWSDLSEMEQYNMRKNLAEFVITTATALAFLVLKPDDDEEVKNPFAKIALTYLDRVSGDLLFFVNPEDWSNTAGRISPLTSTVNNVGRALKYTIYAFDYESKDAFYRSGIRKDEHKLWANIGELLPIIKPTMDVTRVLEEDFIERK